MSETNANANALTVKQIENISVSIRTLFTWKSTCLTSNIVSTPMYSIIDIISLLTGKEGGTELSYFRRAFPEQVNFKRYTTRQIRLPTPFVDKSELQAFLFLFPNFYLKTSKLSLLALVNHLTNQSLTLADTTNEQTPKGRAEIVSLAHQASKQKSLLKYKLRQRQP